VPSLSGPNSPRTVTFWANWSPKIKRLESFETSATLPVHTRLLPRMHSLSVPLRHPRISQSIGSTEHKDDVTVRTRLKSSGGRRANVKSSGGRTANVEFPWLKTAQHGWADPRWGAFHKEISADQNRDVPRLRDRIAVRVKPISVSLRHCCYALSRLHVMYW